MHAWRLGFGTVVMAVSAVTWLAREGHFKVPPRPGTPAGVVMAHVGTGPAQAPDTSNRCLMAQPGRAAPPIATDPLALLPLQPQDLRQRPVVLVDTPVAPVALASQAGRIVKTASLH